MPSQLSSETIAQLHSLCALLVETKPHLRPQVRKAYDLLLIDGVRPCPFFPGNVNALSSNGVTEYQVSAGLCECPAGAQGKLCYHRLARRLYWVAQREEARQAAAARVKPVRKPSQSAQLGARTRSLHDLNAKRAAALPLATVTNIRRSS